MPKTYVGVSDVARRAKKIYIGDSNNTARLCKKIYVGDSNNVARLCYMRTETSLFFYGAYNDTVSFAYDGATYRFSFGSQAFYQLTIPIVDPSPSITFRSELTGYSRTVTITPGQTNTIYVRPKHSVYWYGFDAGSLIRVNCDETNYQDQRYLRLYAYETGGGVGKYIDNYTSVNPGAMIGYYARNRYLTSTVVWNSGYQMYQMNIDPALQVPTEVEWIAIGDDLPI